MSNDKELTVKEINDLNTVKKFLREKRGYLKKGNEACAYGLMRKYNKTYQFKLIKTAKKEVKKEIKEENSLNKMSDNFKSGDVKINANIAEDFRDHFEDNRRKLEQTPFAPTLKKEKAPKQSETPNLKEQVGMHILLGCNHVPFHNKKLHHGIRNLMRDYQYNIKGFHLLGDFADLNTLSSHDKKMFTAVPGLTLDIEYDACNEELDLFEKFLPEGTWKTYLYGNHEDRHNRWMKNMDNAKTPLLSPMEAMTLEERGYHVKNKWSQDYFVLGNDFQIFHGVYFSIHNGKAHLDKLRTSCAYVHTHRIQNYREGNMAAFNIGACANFNSSAFNYASRPMKNQWANGFAINMIDEKGRSNVTQIYVNPDGTFWFGGRLY